MNAASPSPGRPYEPPTIAVLGTVADLTAGEDPGSADLDGGLTGIS